MRLISSRLECKCISMLIVFFWIKPSWFKILAMNLEVKIFQLERYGGNRMVGSRPYRLRWWDPAAGYCPNQCTMSLTNRWIISFLFIFYLFSFFLLSSVGGSFFWWPHWMIGSVLSKGKMWNLVFHGHIILP